MSLEVIDHTNFIKQALRGEALTIYGDGNQTRSFCYVDDLIEGIFKLYISNETYPVNLGNPEEISILKLAQIINEFTKNTNGITAREGLRIEGDPQRRQPDITKAAEVLSWKPTINLMAGLEKTIPYFKTVLGLR